MGVAPVPVAAGGGCNDFCSSAVSGLSIFNLKEVVILVAGLPTGTI